MSEIRDDATREELDARLVRDVKQWRHAPSVSMKLRHAGKVDLDLEELDALLRTIDRLERELALTRPKRAVEVDALPDDDVPTFKPIAVDYLPAGHALIAGEVVPLPTIFDPNPRAHRAPTLCRYCSTEIRMLGGTWLHVSPSIAGQHPAAPAEAGA